MYTTRTDHAKITTVAVYIRGNANAVKAPPRKICFGCMEKLLKNKYNSMHASAHTSFLSS